MSLRNLFCTLVIGFITYQTSWALVGESCTNSCNDGMVCEDRKCACPRDAIESTDKSKCLPVTSHLGGGCEQDAQCTRKLSDYAQCVDFKCMCKENAIVVNNFCEKKRELGETCSSDNHCKHINDASCKYSVCACNDQFVPQSSTKTTCLPIAVNFQSTCEEDIQCSKGLGDKAFCRDTKCQCIEGFHSFLAFQARCLENKGLKESCTGGECYLPKDGDNQNIDCIDSICTCTNDAKPTADDQSCSGSSGSSGSSSLYGVQGLLTSLWSISLGMSRRNLL